MEKPDIPAVEKTETDIEAKPKPKRRAPVKKESTVEKTVTPSAPKKKAVKPSPESEVTDAVLNWEFVIPALEYEREIDALAENYSQEAKLPGFRKGRVAGSVVKNVYRQTLEEEITGKMVSAAVKERLDQEKIEIVSRPRITSFERNENGDYLARVVLEKRPEFSLPDLGKLRVELKKEELSGPEWNEDKEIEAILMAHRKPEKVLDRPAGEAEVVAIRSQAKIIFNKKMMPRQEGYFRLDGSEEHEILNLREELLGKESGSKLVFQRTYPADYHKKPWAGREIEHQVEITAVYAFRQAEWNDELCRALGVKDESELRQRIRENRRKQLEQARQNLVTDRIIALLLEKVELQVPQSLVEAEFLELLHRNRQHLGNASEEEKHSLLAGLRQAAEKTVRVSLIMEALQRAQGLEVTQADLDRELDVIAAANQVQPAEVRKYMEQEGRLEQLRDRLLESRIIGFLKEKIAVVEV